MRAVEPDGTRARFAEKDAFVAAESTVDFGIAFQGGKTGMKGGEGFVLEKFTGLNRQGMMNAVFGGEGPSLATLEGNGRVILQSLTAESLADADCSPRTSAGPMSCGGPRRLP